MTSAHALQLAAQIIENDRGAVEPLIKLLYAFRASRGDPLGEAMMRGVLKTLYVETDHCEDVGLAGFVGEVKDASETVSAAAA